MPTVTYSNASLADLSEIWAYIADDSPSQADRLIRLFHSKLEYLAQWNTLGRPRPEVAKECRSFPIGKYCIYYRPTDDGIELIRLLHSALDTRQIEFPD